MDNYKFRGQKANNGEWVYGYLIKDRQGDCFIYDPNKGLSFKYLVDPETIGQYSGLKDFYDGDRVFNSNGLGEGYINYNAPSFMVIYPHENNYSLSLDEDLDTLEKVGTIHD